MKIYKSIEKNEAYLRELYKDCCDVIFRTFDIGTIRKRKCIVIYVDGICDKKYVAEGAIKHIMKSTYFGKVKKYESDKFVNDMLPISELKQDDEFEEITNAVFFGDCIVLIEGNDKFVRLATRWINSRAIDEAKSQAAIIGSRDGFNENIRDSTSILRHKIANPKLKFVPITVGSETKTIVMVSYIEGICDKNLIEKVTSDIKNLKLKSVLASGFLQKEIEKKNNSLFPSINATERSDEAASALLQGRVIVLIDNSPFVLMFPTTFKELITTAEDYNESTVKRRIFIALRLVSICCTLLLPAIYISVVEYSPEFITDKIILFIINSRRYIPFQSFTEIILVELIFEIIIEAGIRLPKQIGFTVGIVGSIVIGQAVVDASLVNIMVVIIVALTAISAFVIPNYAFAVNFRVLKFVFMVVAAVGGFFGTIMCLIYTLITLCDLHPYGIEYLYPIVDSQYKFKKVLKEGGDF